MEITHKQMKLTPAERKAVKIMMEALQQGDDFLTIKGFQTKDLSRLKEKLGIRMAESQKSAR